MFTKLNLTPFNNAASLNAQALECIRDDRVLFTELSFELNNGDLLQIEGRNGSGKTSLLRILCGLSNAECGKVLWNQQDIEQDYNAYWQHLAYIGHAAGVKQELTALENLRLARALGHYPTAMSLELAIEQVGLYGFEEAPVRSLSAGQQRRVALARLLINDAQLWILDEPFTALDKKAIKSMEYLLEAHAQRGGLAIVTSHHQVTCPHTQVLAIN
jgi:heme exporter protein A